MTIGSHGIGVHGDYLVPPPGSAAGDRARSKFIADVKAICLPYAIDFFPLPKLSDTTTVTDESKNGAVVTYSESVAAFDTPPGVQGSGVRVYFNGTDEEADTPDAAYYSKGDSVNDKPLSIFGWVNQTATATTKTILSKHDLTSGNEKREWTFILSTTEKLTFTLWDESAATRIGKVSDAALADGADLFVAGVYDGSGADTGIKLYSAAVVLASSAASAGTYTALEDTTTLLRVAHEIGTGATAASLFNGSMLGLPILVGGALSVDQLEALKDAGNAYYDLEL